jgi:hypothetical protein
MGQPEDGLNVELVDALAADSQDRADGRESLRGVAVEAVVGDDDVTQTGGELSGQVVQDGLDLSAVESLELPAVRDPRGMAQVRARETALEGDGPPDSVGDGRDGVAAERDAAPGIVVL